MQQKNNEIKSTIYEMKIANILGFFLMFGDSKGKNGYVNTLWLDQTV